MFILVSLVANFAASPPFPGKALAMASTLFYVLAISALLLGVAESESSVVKEVSKKKQFSGIPGLTHITIAGAVNDGHQEVEIWMETAAPGSETPIHRHDLEEIFFILKGGGTVYISPLSENKVPGEPVASPVFSNTTFSIPRNAVHQFVNTKDEDCQFIVTISRPPMKAFGYKTWDTPHEDAFLIDVPWDKSHEASAKDEL